MVRVPMYKPSKGPSTRIEVRSIDAACNPYLAYAVVLAAGHEGRRRGLRAAPGGRGRRVVAHRPRASAPWGSSRCLRTCDAITSWSDSELVAETLGEHVFDFFLRNKRAEWEDYRDQVTPFELGRYLPRL